MDDISCADCDDSLMNCLFLLALKLLLSLLDPALQLLSPIQNLALPTGPRTNPTPSNSCIEIHLTLFARHPLYLALHTNLSLQFSPPECQAGPFIALNILCFLTRAEIRIDDKTSCIQFFQVYHTGAHSAGGERGCG